MFEFAQAALNPARALAGSAKFLFSNPFNPFAHTTMGRGTAAAAELVERTTRRYEKPEFGITSTVVGGRTVAVCERVVWERPFCRLVQFSRDVPEFEIHPGAADFDHCAIVWPLRDPFARYGRGAAAASRSLHQ